MVAGLNGQLGALARLLVAVVRKHKQEHVPTRLLPMVELNVRVQQHNLNHVILKHVQQHLQQHLQQHRSIRASLTICQQHARLSRLPTMIR